MIIQHLGKNFELSVAQEIHVPELRLLVNASYKELSDMGLNYTATYQDEATTLQRIQSGQAFILTEQARIIATILYSERNYFTKRHTAFLGQLAVKPEYKRQGIGTLLMDYCENLAQQQGYEGIQLDTAIPATHLLPLYEKRGYTVIGTTHWKGKTYDSYIFEKLF